MTIAQQVRELTETATERANAASFLKLARLLIQHRSAPEALASPEGMRANDAVTRYLKSAVVPMGTGNTSALVALTPLADAFSSSLVGSGSVFDTIKAGARVVPADTRISIISGGVTASVVSENAVKPSSSLTLSTADMTMTKVIAHVVISKELSLFSTPEAISLFNSELARALVRAVDAEFLSQLLASTTPTASAGATAVNTLADLNAMLALVDVQPTSQVYLVMSVAKAQTYSQIFTTAGSLLFPGLGPLGGPAISSLQVLTSNQTPSNRVLMIVADGLAIADEPIGLRPPSEQAMISLDTTPDSPPIASSVLVSLWQQDLVGLLAERRFAVVPRARSVASISY